MTQHQRQALDFIAAFIDRTGYSPSLVEIAEHLGLASKSGSHRIIKGLLDRGYLVREQAGTTRSLKVARIGPARLAGVTTDELRAELARRGVVA